MDSKLVVNDLLVERKKRVLSFGFGVDMWGKKEKEKKKEREN